MSNKIETTNGVNINVEDLGGTGNPVVFIHGWPVNYNMFEYQFTELPKHGYRCIGIDYGSLEILTSLGIATTTIQWLMM